MTNKLVVVRHGHTEWSHSGRFTGRTDLSLLPEGEQAARRLQPELAKLGPFAAVYTSPLRRAARTAELAGFATAIPDPNLMEVNYGADDGRTRAEILIDRPGWDNWTDGYEGNAETIDDVAARADRAIATVRAIDGDVLIFAHSHFLCMLAARWLGAAPLFAAQFVLDPTGISVLGWKRERPALVRWNA